MAELVRPMPRPWRKPCAARHCVRHGTAALFAALTVLDGTVIGRGMQRHRHGEALRFLNTIEVPEPAGARNVCGMCGNAQFF